MSDIQELLARLQGGPNTGSGASAGSQAAGNRQPSVSSPVFSPSPHGPQPHHASAIISPNTSAANTPAPQMPNVAQPTPQQQQQSAQLLNLLRFNSQPSVPQQQSIPPHRRSMNNTQAADGASSHGRQVSASDLVASFMGKTSPPAAQHASASATPLSTTRTEPAPESDAKLQDQLLRLLSQPKPSHNEPSRASFTFAPSPSTQAPETAVDDVSQDVADAVLEQAPNDSFAASSPMHVFGSDGAAKSSSFEPSPAAKGPKFTYINPFEKLEAASPRNRTPAPHNSGSPAPKMEILKPKHALEGSSASGGDAKDNHTDKLRKISPGPSAHPHETVAEAVSDLGEQVGQQIDEALAAAETETAAEAAKELERMSPEDVKELEDAVVETAVEIKKELENEDAAKALEEAVGEPIADALKEVASQVAQEGIADSWESAEAEDSSAKDEDQMVIVYQFPMRAFSSITVQNMPSRRATFRPELFMDIARLRKDFDQIDRSLVSATKAFIVYALAKKGGFKIIRQSNGQYRQVFENHHERIFNIALCSGDNDSNKSLESILGIGVNGSVFWTSIAVDREDQWSDNLDTQGLVLPPSPSQDDNTSGGQLKTRAKPSSRHPEFFAVGRGKSIHIIWPRVAQEYAGAKGICQTDKYLNERSLKILTGKAGKDFTFSEDDTVIVSLDKAGRMRFWDIRPLTKPDLGVPRGPAQQLEVSETLLEFYTTSPTAKSWPTSVFFFDKDRPFNKGIALRYVMVGMKQNHTFQLWDLGLGKAVQEINLPHEKESDAICSVAFHPRTGIMAVAHPTRNSIFFVHVSCPRYNLAVMNQANYISRLAVKDRHLPPVNATAIMTSITEYSFAPKGQIRSLHMLNEPAGPPDVDDPENNAMFELYVMHSKGVCTIRVRRQDLGWKKEGEPINPKNAEQENIIVLGGLKPVQPPPSDDASTAGGDTPAQKSSSERSVRDSIKKESSHVSRQSMTPEAAMRASTLAKVESKQDAARAAIINGGEKSEKKKKKRSTLETASQTSSAPRAAPSYAQAAQATPLSKSPAPPEQPAPAPELPSQTADNETPAWASRILSQLGQPSSSSDLDSKVIEEIVSTEISKGFTRELEVLYKRVDDDRRAMNAANGAKQEAILRLVSSTLTDNVEGVIRKMVEENMRDMLLPKMLEHNTLNVEKSVSKNLKSLLATQLTKEVPASVEQALKNPQILHAFTETITKKVALSVENTVSATTGSIINPAIATLTNLIERGVGDQLRHAQTQRQADAAKITQLTETVQTLMETIQNMAANQAELQSQVVKLQQNLTQAPTQPAPVGTPAVNRSPVKPQQKTPEQLETEAITRLMAEGNYEQGTMRWLQSNRTAELFNTVFVKCNPAYLNHVSPLLNLSTGAVVTESLSENLMERLIWLDCVLKNVDPMDPETHDIVPKILDVMNQRLTSAYIKLNETSPGNQLLRRISLLVSRVGDLTRAVQGKGFSG